MLSSESPARLMREAIRGDEGGNQSEAMLSSESPARLMREAFRGDQAHEGGIQACIEAVKRHSKVFTGPPSHERG